MSIVRVVGPKVNAHVFLSLLGLVWRVERCKIKKNILCAIIFYLYSKTFHLCCKK